MNQNENQLKLKEDIANRSVCVTAKPSLFSLESVHGCINPCIMCSHFWRGGKPKQLSSDLLEKVKIFFPSMQSLSITGFGEPLLTKNIDYFIQTTAQNNLFLGISSTGYFLTRELADRLTDTKLAISFSIHAGQKQTYWKIMGKNLDRVRTNITYLMNRIAKKHKTEHRIQLSFIVMRENILEIDDFLNLAQEIGVQHVRFMGLKPNRKTLLGVTRTDKKFRFNYFEQANPLVYKKFFRRYSEIENQARNLGIVITPQSFDKRSSPKPIRDAINMIGIKVLRGRSIFPMPSQRGFCFAPWVGQFIIRQDGDVQLCCDPSYILGNINKQHLEDIWNGTKIQSIRRLFSKGIYPPVCGYCKGVDRDHYYWDGVNI